MADIPITKDRIVADLQTLGLKAGDIVIVHSSLASLGSVEGGAQTVIRALLDVLGEAGTLMMPTFAGPPPFDVKNTVSKLGAITETFRTWPGAVRGFHPSHSVSVLGPKAQDLIRDHLASPSACGKNTPFGRLIDLGGKILLLGVDNDRNTTMHTLEEYAQSPYLSDYETTYLDDNGRVHSHKLKWYPGPHRNFIGVSPILERAGAQVTGKVGQAVARLIDARKMHDTLMPEFRANPALVLCDNPNCADCTMQRAKLRRYRLKSEDFVLTALASSVSPWPEQLACELNRASIRHVVIDRLYDQPVWRLDDRYLRRAARLFAEENIHVVAVGCPGDSVYADHALSIKETLKADGLILPLSEQASIWLDWARGHETQLFFDHGPMLSRTCTEILKAAQAGPVLAFNPASFSLLGEMSFLRVYSKTQIRKYVGMLHLSDATFGGKYTLPGRGNGEVKELLSILRCRSFSGPVVLGTGPGGPEFRDLVESFWKLLETM